MDHGLQVCLFRFLQGRDDLDHMEPEARNNVDRLDNVAASTLAETAETGQDHFRRLMNRKAPVIPLKALSSRGGCRGRACPVPARDLRSRRAVRDLWVALQFRWRETAR